jgi:hypothetical protein
MDEQNMLLNMAMQIQGSISPSNLIIAVFIMSYIDDDVQAQYMILTTQVLWTLVQSLNWEWWNKKKNFRMLLFCPCYKTAGLQNH